MDKREEQINKAGKKYELKNPYNTYINNKVFNSNYEIPAKDFIEGAKWADEHPNWISVEDELPSKDFKDSTFSKDVLVVIYGNIYVGYYVIHKKEWVLYNPDGDYDSSMITHWMPFPKFIKNKD